MKILSLVITPFRDFFWGLESRWRLWTYHRASRRGQRDRRLFGESYMVQHWWGWQYVQAEDVICQTRHGAE